MQNKGFFLYLSLVVLIILAMVVSSFAASVPRMSSDELNTRLSEEGLVVLDARSPFHWGSSNIKILGAERVEPGAVSAWSGNYSKEQTLVLYCAWTSEGTSASVARQLMNMGYQKVYALKGGWNEWQSKKLPVEAK